MHKLGPSKVTPSTMPTLMFSEQSSPAVPDSLFYQENFMLGAGMVIIQPSMSKILVIHDERRKYWFLPKGRKDIGESIEQAALREAYEESGYRATFLPLYQRHHAPAPERSAHRSQLLPTVEPIFVEVRAWFPGQRRTHDTGGEYFVHWYVGFIPEDAVHEPGTGMPDELNYRSHLLSPEEAFEKLGDTKQGHIARVAWDLWEKTKLETKRASEGVKETPASTVPQD